MKKLILISIILILSLSVKAQFYPKVAFDYFQSNYRIKVQQPLPSSYGVDNNYVIMNYGHFRVRTGMEYRINRMSVYFDQSMYVNKVQDISFQPTQAEFHTGLKYRLMDKIFISAEHFCYHPVISDNEKQFNQARVYGGGNCISISYGY